MTLLITPTSLSSAVGCSLETADKFAVHLQKVVDAYQINTKNRLTMFLAQIAHESARLSALRENLNYSASSLARTWPTRYAVDAKAIVKVPNAKALLIAHKPEMIANATYGGRYGNGDEASGDGWLYAGKGLKQLTFKDNYAAATIGLKAYRPLCNYVINPELVAEPEDACWTAGWYWYSRNCNALADTGNFEGTTRVINGGLIGQEQRVVAWARAQSRAEILGVA